VPAVLFTLPSYLDDSSIIGASDVTDVGTYQLVSTKPCQKCGQNARTVAFYPVILAQ
jgi:hypothetical protein